MAQPAVESTVRLNTGQKTQTLLVLGPQPPPLGGATTTFQLFLDEAVRRPAVRLVVINTSPPAFDYRKQTVLGLETWRRAVMVLWQYFKKIKGCDAVLIFGTAAFIFTLGPVLLMLARWQYKPLYFKPFGGSFDMRLAQQKPFVRAYLLNLLRRLDGLLVQTHQIQAGLAQLGCTNIYQTSGFRPAAEASPRPLKNSDGPLRAIFLSHIRREKGPFELLEALGILALEGKVKVICDFYGPIFADDKAEFLRQLELTPGAQYCGVVEIGTAPYLMTDYDIFILPTYFTDEGHSGAIIEAMQANLPIISTHFRAIPEMVTHGENGLLVPVQDSAALAEAIKCLALDNALRERMRAASYRRSQAYRADVVVSQILGIIFPNEHP